MISNRKLDKYIKEKEEEIKKCQKEKILDSLSDKNVVDMKFLNLYQDLLNFVNLSRAYNIKEDCLGNKLDFIKEGIRIVIDNRGVIDNNLLVDLVHKIVVLSEEQAASIISNATKNKEKEKLEQKFMNLVINIIAAPVQDKANKKIKK